MARKPWLATDIEDWNLDSKSADPPGRGMSTRPTISSHKKNAVVFILDRDKVYSP